MSSSENLSCSPEPEDDQQQQQCAVVSSQPQQQQHNTIVTRNCQKIVSQQIITSRRVQKIVSSSQDNNQLSLEDGSMQHQQAANDEYNNNISGGGSSSSTTVVTNDNGGSSTTTTNKNVKRITKTYRRRIIKTTGPNGEVSEQIIEEGDPIDPSLLAQLPPSSSADQSSSGVVANLPQSGPSKFQAVAGFKTISESGEETSAQLSSGPMTLQAIGGPQSSGLALCGPPGDDSGSTVQEVLPDGTVVTRKFYGKKTATVTHSSTINGETKTTSKSAFMCFAGESMSQAQSSMDDMENMFQNMMKTINHNAFSILDQFIQSKDNNIMDHLALAGGCGSGEGDDSSPTLAIEGTAPVDHHHDNHHESSGAVAMLNRFIRRPIIKAIAAPHQPDHTVPSSDIQSSSVSPPCPASPAPAATQNGAVIPEAWVTPHINEQQEQDLVRRKIEEIRQKATSKALYWSDMDEVRSSGILQGMKKEEIHLQEAMFEIITSEASYNIGLDTLIDYYYKNEMLNPAKSDASINHVEKHHLFSNILLIKGVSYKLLKDLESRWCQQKPKLNDLGDVILKHAEDENFQQQYVKYLTNQSYQIEALKALLQKDQFKQSLCTIQRDPRCGKLSLDSFLALPMQRLTRMKLLVEVVLKLMRHSPEFLSRIPPQIVRNYENALDKLKYLLSLSEETKFRMEQKARMLDLLKILEFIGPCKCLSFANRELLKEGDIRAHSSQQSATLIKKFSKKKQPFFYLIIFNDLIIIAKRKCSPTKLLVMDYCDRDGVTATVELQPASQPPQPANKVSRERSVGSSMSSSTSYSAKDSTASLADFNASCFTFVLRFEASISGLLTEPLTLAVSTLDQRDQWLSAIA